VRGSRLKHSKLPQYAPGVRAKGSTQCAVSTLSTRPTKNEIKAADNRKFARLVQPQRGEHADFLHNRRARLSQKYVFGERKWDLHIGLHNLSYYKPLSFITLRRGVK